jgi:hypothetical protein
MNNPSLSEVKAYLGLDGDEQNPFLALLISSAEHLVEKVLRRPLDEKTPEIVKTAILYTVWQMYFHRDNGEFNMAEIEKTVAIMLSDLRVNKF